MGHCLNNFGQCPALGLSTDGLGLSNSVVSSSYVKASKKLYVSGLFDESEFQIDGNTLNQIASGFLRHDLYLMQTSNSLNVDWIVHIGKSVGFSTSSRVHGVSDGVIAAYQFVDTVQFLSQTFIVSAGGNAENALISKVSSTGVIQWIYQLYSTGTTQINSISTDSIGNIYLIGNYYKDVTLQNVALTSSNPLIESGEVFIGKLDTVGNLIWLKHLAGGAANDVGYHLSIEDGSLLVSGFFEGQLDIGNDSFTSASSSDGFIARLDTSGNVEWSAHLKGNSTVRDVEIIPYKNGCVASGWFAGSLDFENTSIISSGGNDFFVARFDNQGQLVWMNKIGGSLTEVFNRLEYLNSDFFLISGSSESNFSINNLQFQNQSVQPSGRNGVIFVMNSLGIPVCLSSLPSSNNSSAFVEYIDIDTLMLAGVFTQEVNLQNISLNADGTSSFIGRKCLPCDNINSIPGNTTPTAQIYPNPFIGQTTVKLTQPIQNGTLQLHDALGRLVREERVQSQQFTIGQGGLPAGLYFLSLYGQEQKLGTWRLAVSG